MKRFYSKLLFWALLAMLFVEHSLTAQCNQSTNIEAIIVENNCIANSVTYGVTFSSEVAYGMNSICYGYAVTNQGQFVESQNYGPIDQQDHLNNPYSHYIELTISCQHGLTLFLHAWSNHECGGNPCDYPHTQVLVLSPLPVTLQDFFIQEDKKGLLLTWRTSTEKNNKGFEIQHSRNANQWDVIGFVEGSGNTDFTVQYQYLHESPSLGTNYYRLNQMDFDGTVHYSPTLSFFVRGESGLFPTITSDYVYIYHEEERFYYMVDQLGAIIRTGMIGPEFSKLDISDIRAGWYYILTEENQALRFYKQ